MRALKPRPDWLLNITNDAWFGFSAGPYQHLAAVRFRAIELGVPLVRSANTGISALIDPYGRVIKKINLGDTGVIDFFLPARILSPPFYGRVGELVTIVLFTFIFLISFVFRRK